MKNQVLRLLGAASLLCLAGCGNGHTGHGGHEDDCDDHDAGHADEVTLTPEAIERWNIRVEPAGRHVLTPTVSAPARVSFNLEAVAHVGSVVSGRVGRIDAKLGDTVSAGDELLVVVSPEWGQAQSDFLQKRGEVASAEATWEVARSLYDSAKALYEESRGIALSEVRKREAEFRAAGGSLTASRSALTAAENALHILGMDQRAVQALAQTGEIDPNFTVRAPIDGQVIEREVTLGESVGPDREALLVVADMGRLWVIADVSEPHISQISAGARATVRVQGGNGVSIPGLVSFIGAQVHTATRTIPVRVEVSNDAGALRPGMFAQVWIDVGQGQAVVAAPETSVQTIEGQPSVFVPVAEEPHTFTVRPVRVGPAVGRMVPILAGLREGEPFVVEGSFILKAELGKAGAAHEH